MMRKCAAIIEMVLQPTQIAQFLHLRDNVEVQMAALASKLHEIQVPQRA